MTTTVSRFERKIIRLAVSVLRTAMAESGRRRADTLAVQLALNCLLRHCPERWPLAMFWDAAQQENDIGRAQGCTAAFAGVVKQLRRAGRYPEPSE